MHMSSLNFEQGDVVVADLLFSEQVGAKRRPAVVISNSHFNKKSEDIILLKISSKAKKTEFDVSISAIDFEEGHLKVESKIMVDNLVNCYKQLITARVGKIKIQKLNEVKQKLMGLFEL